MEKTVPTATFQELWQSKLPDFRARNEIRNLTREGIKVEIMESNFDWIKLRAYAESVPDIRYLFGRGYRKCPYEPEIKEPSDVVRTILARPRTGSGGIPLTRGEVAMLFLDGYAGDHPNLLSVYSRGYGDDCSPPARGGVAEGRGGGSWHGLTPDDVLEDENTTFVWTKWEPLELWPIE